tara:strand:+ start:42 stop:392 length:351 start_codon:yes stop_codon:yes gene_type:complete
MAGIGDYNKKGKGNRGFRMKGSEFFGHGSDSPAKVSDKEVMDLQSKLNKQELDFKEPGWAKVAGKLHDPLGVMGGNKGGKGGGAAGGGGGIDKGKALDIVQKTVQERAADKNLKGV